MKFTTSNMASISFCPFSFFFVSINFLHVQKSFSLKLNSTLNILDNKKFCREFDEKNQAR